MKKIIVGVVALFLCVCMTACGNQTETTVSSLTNQLDNTTNTVSCLENINPNDISFENEEEFEDIYNQSRQTQNTILSEHDYKSEILTKITEIKDLLSTDLRLSTNQTNALKEHIKTLEKQIELISNTKNDLNSHVKSINSLRKDKKKNNKKIQAKLNQVECGENLRCACYQNILSTLDQIDDCVQEETSYSTQEDQSSQKSQSEKTRKNHLPKNIDTYRPIEEKKEKIDKTQNKFENQLTRNIDTYGPRNRNIDTLRTPNNFNTPFSPYRGFGNCPYSNYGYGYGMPYANPYGYNNFANPYYPQNSNNTNRVDFDEEKTITPVSSPLEEQKIEKESEKENQNFEDEIITSSSHKEKILKKIKNRLIDEKDPIVVAH